LHLVNHRIIVFLLSYLLILVGVIALFRLIAAEVYAIVIMCLAIIISIAAVRRDNFVFLYSILATYIVICLSWVSASHSTTLPCDDICHYYPFAKFVYEFGHFTYPGMEKELEQIFLGNVASWPGWHIFLASLSNVLGLDLFYTVQVAQSLSTTPLALLTSFIIGKTLLYSKRGKAEAPYLLTVMIPFLSFYVYSNTNPVSRSFTSVLYLLNIYVLFKSIIERYECWFIILLILLLSIVYSHPTWSLLGSLTLLLTPITILLADKFILRRQNDGESGDVYIKTMFLISLVALSSSVSWIFYSTYFARLTFVKAVETLLSGLWRDILGLSIARDWLQTQSLGVQVFKTHVLEPVISWMVWVTDLTPIVVAILGLILALKMLLHKELIMLWKLTLALIIASTLVTLITGMSSSGLITRYGLLLIYIPLLILATLTIQKLQERIQQDFTDYLIDTYNNFVYCDSRLKLRDANVSSILHMVT